MTAARTEAPPRNAAHVLFGVILVLYLMVGTLFALRTPAWQAPDEPAHYNYIAQLAKAGCCPVIASGDWDQAYLSELTRARFDPALLGEIDRVQYEDHQPPLYYLALTSVFALTGGSLEALRLASVLIGAVIVISAYGVGLAMFPDRPQIGLGAAAFVAFLPQHVAILASVNNDALGWALAAVLLWMSVFHVKAPRGVPVWLFGLVMGAAFLTKATAYMMAAVVLLAIVFRWRRERAPLRALIGDAALFLIPAAALGSLWWLRNFGVYGFPDFLGLAAHDAVVVGQPRTAALIERLGFGGYLREAADVTLSSFVGRFGWMALPLIGGSVGWITPLYVVMTVAALLGHLVDARRMSSTLRAADQRAAWTLLAITALLAVLAYAYYNTQFQQFQGRYMYPLLIPLGVWLAYGLDVWRRLILGRWPLTRWAVPLALTLMAPLDVWLLLTVIVPNLTPV
jgi:4-amino-4-deoxy-L-arabinose transferase-like glycosyltransferase